MKVLWYISPVDGRYPWHAEGRYEVKHERLRRLATYLDNAGFYGALIGTYAHDVLVTATSLIPVTQRLRFLIPIYPGVTPPALLAQQTLTFDDYSNGRLLLNLVNGTDNVLARYGVFVQSSERYRMSAEYWKLFRRLYAGEIILHQGEYLAHSSLPKPEDDKSFPPTQLPLGPIQAPCIPLWGAGASPAGIEHAAQVVDTYLTFLQDPATLKVQIDAAKAAAAQQGRELTIGTLASVIVRETEEEALAHLQWQLDHTNPQELAEQINTSLLQRGISGGLAELESRNTKVQQRIKALREGRVPSIKELEIAPNLYAGLAVWAQFDVQDTGGDTYFVGSAQQIAARMNELKQNLGIEAFILSGWPLNEEAGYVAELLLPLLDLQHEPPALAKPRG